MRREDARVRVRSRQPLFLCSLVVCPPDLEQKHAKNRRETGLPAALALRSLAIFCKQQGIWRTLWFGFNRSSQRTAKACLPAYSFCAFCLSRPMPLCGSSRPSVQHRVCNHLLLGCVHRRLRIPTQFTGRSGLAGTRSVPRSSTAPSERSPYLMLLRTRGWWERPARAFANIDDWGFYIGICCAIPNRKSPTPNPQSSIVARAAAAAATEGPTSAKATARQAGRDPPDRPTSRRAAATPAATA